ncbi:MAG: SDR family NAD(P)-dependent oxidoreductase [Gammaproteobacteria bacterium]
MNSRKRIILIGASSAIAEQCARRWTAESPSEMVLVGRDESKLNRIAADLRVRTPESIITCIETNFLDQAQIQDTVDKLCEKGRKSNYVYGAAKGLVSRYAQGLQHRLAHSGIRVVLIKPGPTDTPMTTHLKQAGQRLASAESVAKDIVNGIDRGKRVIYAPRKWTLIMLIIRHMPHFIFKHLDI